MNKTGHTVGAVISTCIALYYLENPYMIPGIIIGNFLPDLDAEYSYIQTKSGFKQIGKVLKFCKVKHRGALLHSFLTLLPFIYFCENSFMLSLGIGIFSHHVLDMLTPAGLRYFYPSKIKIRI